MPELRFNTQFEPQTGRPVTVADGVVRVTAPNPGPFTFTGTNSYLIGTDEVFVLDAGPAGPKHRGALLKAIGGRPVRAIVLTHTHRDHSGGAAGLKQATGAPIWFAGHKPLPRRPRLFDRIALGRETDRRLAADRVLADGETIETEGARLEVIATPGHAANHLAFELVGTPVVFTGDHIMGWNSTVVAPPDGSMGDYLASLRKIIGLGPRRYLPGHGGPIEDGPTYAEALFAHREQRNDQIIAAVQSGAHSIGELVVAIYPHVSLAVRPAAMLTLQAHLEYLVEAGEVILSKGVAGPRIALASAR